MHVKLRN